MIDKKIREDFPILKKRVNDKKIVYLDNAATSQKPKQVIATISDYYKNNNANVHRGIHTLSVEATEMYERVREKVAKFVGVKDSGEIIFVKNATEAINLVAYSWGRLNISKGDEIVLTVAEHHSNFVPWQQLAIENGATLKIVPIRQAHGLRPVDKNGELDLVAFKKALTKKTKLVTFFHVSNVLGTINPARDMVRTVRKKAPKAKILVDGAQAVPHMPVDISKIGCDFYVFTGHKMLGPTGIGVLFSKREILEQMPPFLFGGEMISTVDFGKSSWNDLPWKFEAGTPNIAGAVGLGAAVDYLEGIGMDKIRQHEVELTKYAIARLSTIEDIVMFGPTDFRKRGGVVSFNIGSPSTPLRISDPSTPLRISDPSTRSAPSGSSIHAHDVASILDSLGVAIRSGQHCAEPLMKFLNISSVARASFNVYNTKEDIDKMIEGIEKVRETFKLNSAVYSPRPAVKPGKVATG